MLGHDWVFGVSFPGCFRLEFNVPFSLNSALTCILFTFADAVARHQGRRAADRKRIYNADAFDSSRPECDAAIAESRGHQPSWRFKWWIQAVAGHGCESAWAIHSQSHCQRTTDLLGPAAVSQPHSSRGGRLLLNQTGSGGAEHRPYALPRNCAHHECSVLGSHRFEGEREKQS